MTGTCRTAGCGRVTNGAPYCCATCAQQGVAAQPWTAGGNPLSMHSQSCQARQVPDGRGDEG